MGAVASIRLGRPEALPRYARERASRDVYQLIYREFVSEPNKQLDGLPRFTQAYVFSDETPAGFYRWLVGLSGWDSNASGSHNVDFHIVPSSARWSILPFVYSGNNQPKGTFTFFLGTGEGGDFPYLFQAIFPPTLASVKVSPLSFGGGGSSSFVQLDGVGGMPIAVPEGWRLLAFQDNNTHGEAIHFIGMRMLYYELPLGTHPPSVTRQLP